MNDQRRGNVETAGGGSYVLPGKYEKSPAEGEISHLSKRGNLCESGGCIFYANEAAIAQAAPSSTQLIVINFFFFNVDVIAPLRVKSQLTSNQVPPGGLV